MTLTIGEGTKMRVAPCPKCKMVGSLIEEQIEGEFLISCKTCGGDGLIYIVSKDELKAMDEGTFWDDVIDNRIEMP